MKKTLPKRNLKREEIDRLARENPEAFEMCIRDRAYAAQKGMDVVVTDHHMPPDTLPRAVAVVDPHRADCASRCKDYAGVGVAFKLVCALEGDADTVAEEYGCLLYTSRCV